MEYEEKEVREVWIRRGCGGLRTGCKEKDCVQVNAVVRRRTNAVYGGRDIGFRRP